MSLFAREQQALLAIEERLARSDPKLASLLGMFTRLTSCEAMPVRERMRPGWRCTARRRRRSRAGLFRSRAARPVRQVYRRMGWQRAVLLLWLLIALALTATGLGLSRSGNNGTCTPSWAVTCASSTSASHVRPAWPAGAIARRQAPAAMIPGRSR
jgi:hypothetical protein